MMNDECMLRLDCDTVLRGVRNLPSLPTVVIELLQTLDTEDIDIQQLAEKLARDQALAAKVLRVANSSFYGLQGKVDSIGDAIVVLGLQGVRTLATAAAVSNVFAPGTHADTASYDLRAFWRHSIAVALGAKEIARKKHMNEGNAFAAGLLHDIGRLALASCFPAHLGAVAASRTTTDDSWLNAEQNLLGLDHAEIGRILTEYWRFPALLSRAIGSHHTPATENDTLAAIIHVSDVIAHALDLVGDDSELVPSLDANAWQAIGFSDDDWLALLTAVEAEFEAACEALVS